jgi:hypothetical protein
MAAKRSKHKKHIRDPLKAIQDKVRYTPIILSKKISVAVFLREHLPDHYGDGLIVRIYTVNKK